MINYTKKFLAVWSVLLAVGGCVLSPPPQAVMAPPPPMAEAAPAPSPQAQPYCREYTQKMIVAGQTHTTYGTACRQPDGTWAIQPTADQAGQAQPPQAIGVPQPVYATPAPVYGYPAPVYAYPAPLATSVGVVGVFGGRR